MDQLSNLMSIIFKQKAYLPSKKIDQLSNLNPDFNSVIFSFDWYLSQLIGLLKLYFNKTFLSIITKVACLFHWESIQFTDQVRIKIISLLIKGSARVLQNVLKYFNGIAISVFIVLH